MISLLKLYFEALKGFRWKSVWLILLSATSGLLEGVALTTLMPLLNQNLKAHGTSSFELFGKAYQFHNQRVPVFGILTAFCFLGLVSSSLKLIMESRTLRMRIALERIHNERLVKAVLKTNWITFLSVRFGDVSKAINIESRNLAFGCMAIISMLGLSITVMSLLGIAYGLSPHLTAMTLGFGCLMWIVYRNFTTHYGKDSAKLSSTSSEINHDIQQLLGNLKFMRSTGLGSQILTRMSASFCRYEEVFLSLNIYNHFMRFSFEVVGLIFVTAFITISVWRVPEALGRVIIFLAVFYRIAPRFSAIQERYAQASNEQGWYRSWRSLYQQVSNTPDLQTPASEVRAPEFTHAIEMRGIHFAYAGRPILTDIHWTLPKGKCLAIVGESGSGKTTMIDLVTRLIQPSDGQLFLDETPFSVMDLRAWQSRIGLVMQNSPIFHTTLLENIAWGDDAPNVEAAEAAVKMAHAWEFISRLPEKWNTVLGDKGARISAGEGQRIALARALYRKPWLLILDEATSALDAESETIIQETLQQIKGRVTILMVAHRIHTAQLADEILVLDEGKIIERGTYSDLLHRTEGRFQNLARLQGLLN